MRRTKIVCTIGPSIDTVEQIERIIDAGMDVARLNLSHGSSEDHYRRLELIRTVSRKKRHNVGIMIDTRGPEVRTGNLVDEPLLLEDGQDFTLTTAAVCENDKRVGVTYDNLHLDLEPGDKILIDDGLIVLKVEEITGRDICCRVIHGGELRSYKGLNTPGTRINLPAMGEADRVDIETAIENDVDFMAASFTRTADDIIEIRKLVEKHSGRIMILAKIESREGVDNFDSILEVADGIMVARGDLGVEIPPEEVPLLQKEFIRKCNLLGKPVITATQMLDSMIRNSRPTRAEASDVANAIIDGTDAVMLSGETAIGRFPVEAVQTMMRIAEHTENGLDYKKVLAELGSAKKNTVTDAISYSTCNIGFELDADAIITSTQSGYTARMVSKYRPRAPVVAVTSVKRVATQLTLTRGVQSIICPPVSSTDEMFNNAIRASLDEGLIESGNLVIITAGVPVGVSGTTNLLRVETVGEIMARGTGVGRRAVSGKALVARTGADIEHFEEGYILVAAYIDRKFMPAVKKASALVTEEGGLTSDGAIMAVSLGKPAVVGVEGATGLLKTGDMVTVDAIRGLIYRGKAHVL